MNQEIQRCNQCRRACFTDNLQCNRGRMYFESLNNQQTVTDVTEESVKNTLEEIPNDKLISASKDKENFKEEANTEVTEEKLANASKSFVDILLHKRDWHISRDDHKKNKRRMKNMAHYDKQGNELLYLLEKSGHFLHHKHKKGKGQAKILSILAKNPNISQKDLQELLEIQSGSISEIAKKLEKKGFITREKDKEDKRMTKLTLTEEGLSRLKLIEEREKTTDKQIFQSLSEEEQETLKGLLSKLLEDWNITDDFSKKDKHHQHGHHKHHHEDHHHHRHHEDHHGHHHGNHHREHLCECGCYDVEESYVGCGCQDEEEIHGGCSCQDEVENGCVCGCQDEEEGSCGCSCGCND